MRIYQQARRSAVGVHVAIAVVSSITAASFGANADLSGWVGTNNTAAPNNYSVISTTSAGGAFNDRPPADAFLSDDSLTVDPIDWSTEVHMSGTMTFSSTIAVDPTLFFGWYNSATPKYRIGFGFADAIGSDPTKLRIMTQSTAASAGGTGITSQGIFGSGSTATINAASTLPSGTYAFTFDYDSDGHMTGTFGVDANNVPQTWARNFAFPAFYGNDLNMDRFGFYQNTAAGSTGAFNVTVSNITYTGQTDAAGGVAGDYNHNGTVDAADYVVWRKGDLAADGTGPSNTPDGLVNALDYNFWRARFGNASGSGSSLSNGSAVPEPAALTLAILSIGMLLPSRNRATAP
jgi:hypothetical protein